MWRRKSSRSNAPQLDEERISEEKGKTAPENSAVQADIKCAEA